MIAVRLDRRMLPRLDASDVVQEVLLRASTQLDDYVASPPLPFFAWLRQIAWEQVVKLHQRHLLAQKRTVNRESRWDGNLPDESAAALADRIAGVGEGPTSKAIRVEM